MADVTEYFRAPHAEVVVRALTEETRRVRYELGLLEVELPESTAPEAFFGSGLTAFERISSFGMERGDLLAELIAVIRRVPTSQHLVGRATVWPTTPVPAFEEFTEDDPWVTGPWVREFDTGVRDTLAGVPERDIPEVATRWGRTPAVRACGAGPGDLRAIVEQLVAFARRARAHDERIYSWHSR